MTTTNPQYTVSAGQIVRRVFGVPATVTIEWFDTDPTTGKDVRCAETYDQAMLESDGHRTFVYAMTAGGRLADNSPCRVIDGDIETAITQLNAE